MDTAYESMQAIEQALYLDSLGTGPGAEFRTNGKSLRSEKGEWWLSDETLKGLSIRNAEKDSCWTISFNGKIVFGNAKNRYKTKYTINARILPENAQGKNHYNWELSITGRRDEDDGFMAEFYTNVPLFLKWGSTRQHWNGFDGSVHMTVYHYGNICDEATLSYCLSKSNLDDTYSCRTSFKHSR